MGPLGESLVILIFPGLEADHHPDIPEEDEVKDGGDDEVSAQFESPEDRVELFHHAASWLVVDDQVKFEGFEVG